MSLLRENLLLSKPPASAFAATFDHSTSLSPISAVPISSSFPNTPLSAQAPLPLSTSLPQSSGSLSTTTPVAANSITNRQATSSASIYPICSALRERLKRVPGFAERFLAPRPVSAEHLNNQLFTSSATAASLGKEVNADDEFSRGAPPSANEVNITSNPVMHVWLSFRLGTSLAFLFNSLETPTPIPDLVPTSLLESDRRNCKIALMAFLKAMKNYGLQRPLEGKEGWDEQKLFTVTEIMSGETNGLLKVSQFRLERF